jgi:hypothetical protein
MNSDFDLEVGSDLVLAVLTWAEIERASKTQRKKEREEKGDFRLDFDEVVESAASNSPQHHPPPSSSPRESSSQ